MKTKDFEQAIACINAEILRFRYKADGKGEVDACFAQLNLTYIKWDANGRAYIFNIQGGKEDCVSEYNLEFLPYERDSKFDLVFE